MCLMTSVMCETDGVSCVDQYLFMFTLTLNDSLSFIDFLKEKKYLEVITLQNENNCGSHTPPPPPPTTPVFYTCLDYSKGSRV